MRPNTLLLFAVGLLSGACDHSLLAPGSEFVDGFQVDLVLDRTEVAPGETFTATFSIHNSRDESVTIESLCVALARGVVYRDGHEARLIGSGSGCYTAIGHVTIEPGDSFVREWEVTAATILKAYPDGRPPDTEPAEPGDYLFRVEFDIYRINGEDAELPDLGRRFVVEP